MLKAVVGADQSVPAIPTIKNLLRIIAVEDGVLLSDPAYFDALLDSFSTKDDWAPGTKTIAFFDNCASRIARQPVHYEDLVAETRSDAGVICLLPFCIAEQWHFAIKSADSDAQVNLAEWIVRLFVLIERAGEDKDVLLGLYTQIVHSTKDAIVKQGLKKAHQSQMKENIGEEQAGDLAPGLSELEETRIGRISKEPVLPEAIFKPQSKRIETMVGLDRLAVENLEEVVTDGRLGRLCQTLSSSVEETRRQGYMTLQAMMKPIEVSDADW
jgi:nucleolar pre-ribosomal-associated protein 1